MNMDYQGVDETNYDETSVGEKLSETSVDEKLTATSVDRKLTETSVDEKLKSNEDLFVKVSHRMTADPTISTNSIFSSVNIYD